MTTSAKAVEITLPGVLEMAVGANRITGRGNTVLEALRSTFDRHPQLEGHLLLETGELRPHVLCVVNGECVLRDEVASFELHEGDEILIHQAISGG